MDKCVNEKSMDIVGILIPVYNQLEFTKKSLLSIKDQISEITSGCKYEIIVTDDGSSDGTSEWISNNHPDVHIVQGDGNLWWSGGVNVGAEYAIRKCKANYLLLWNNDIISAPDYFTELTKLVTQEDKTTVIGSKVLFSDKPDTIISYGCFFNPKTGIKCPYGYEKQDSEEFNKVIECDWLFGMGTLVPSVIAEELNFWDAKNFPQYHGDSDFTFRAKKAGYKVKVVPQLKIWNNTENTGNNFPKTLKAAYNSLTSIRSDYNLKVEFKFHRLHSKGIFWVFGFMEKYFFFVYGFFKRKIRSLFGR